MVSPVCACVGCHCLLSYSLGQSLQCVHVWGVTVYCLIVWDSLSSVCVVCQCLLSYSLGQFLQCVHVWGVTAYCLIVWDSLSSVCMCGVSLPIVL